MYITPERAGFFAGSPSFLVGAVGGINGGGGTLIIGVGVGCADPGSWNLKGFKLLLLDAREPEAHREADLVN